MPHNNNRSTNTATDPKKQIPQIERFVKTKRAKTYTETIAITDRNAIHPSEGRNISATTPLTTAQTILFSYLAENKTHNTAQTSDTRTIDRGNSNHETTAASQQPAII